MSIESMNEHNGIGRQTDLYGYIAEEAQQNRLSVSMNRLFKAANDDAMMIPMNIREDDFYFTLSNMREAQLKGTFIGSEFVKSASEIVDEQSELAERCGACDVVLVKEKKLIGDYIALQSVYGLLEEYGAKKVAVIGSGTLAKALALSNTEYELFFYHEFIESLMTLSQEVDIDINRLNAESDLSQYDAVIDASTIETLSMLTTLPELCIDLKNSRQVSALRQRATELGVTYQGYEEQLARMTQNSYDYIKNN